MTPVTDALVRSLRSALGEDAVSLDAEDLVTYGRDWKKPYSFLLATYQNTIRCIWICMFVNIWRSMLMFIKFPNPE